VTARPLLFVPSGKIRDERRMIQLINTHLEHWNTLNQEDVEGLPENIEAIKEIAVQDIEAVEAEGTPFTTPGGLPAKFVDIVVPSTDAKSHVMLAWLNGDAGAVVFFTDVTTAPGILRVSWYDQLYIAYSSTLTSLAPLTISATPAVIPIDSQVLDVNIALAADALTVTYSNIYKIRGMIGVNDISRNGTITLNIRVDGVPIGAGIELDTSNQVPSMPLGFEVIRALSAGEAVDFTLAQDGGSNGIEIAYMTTVLENIAGDGRVWTSAEFRALIVTPE
jgi:hypothetical protein